jgi:CheY-like chemotaxis protein
MAEQTNYLLLLVEFFSGVLLFVLAVVVFKGKLSAAKRKKTKLGLVKVAGAGLKISDEEPGASGQPAGAAGNGGEEIFAADADAGDETGTDGAQADMENNAEANADADAGIDAGASAETGIEAYIGTDSGAARGAAAADVAADGLTGGAVPDVPVDFGENAEYDETLAVPLGLLDADEEDDEAVSGLPEPPLKPAGVASGGDKGYSTVRVISKDLEKPSENPFIGGKFSPNHEEPAKKPPAPIRRRRLPETVKMKDRKVILAEDVAINRELIAMYFDGSGVKFEFAVNGREVCEKFERDPGAYSLILMDIQMPEMDGYQVARKIRSMDTDWAKQIPIIALTGNDQKEDIDLCFDAGMDDHISKPIDMELLQEKVFDIITLNAD